MAHLRTQRKRSRSPSITYDGHWFFLHTPAAGGTYRVEVFATDRAQNVTSRSATFSVYGDLPSGPADPPVEDPPVEDPPSDPPWKIHRQIHRQIRRQIRRQVVLTLILLQKRPA